MTGSRPLVVGIGNRHRGDDAVGPLIVDVIQADPDRFPVAAVSIDGDLSDLALRWRPDQDVLLVDAMVSGRPPGTVLAVDGLRDRLPTAQPAVSSHTIGPADAIELARLLDRLPRSLTVVAVEAEAVGHLEPISAAVAPAMARIIDRIAVWAAHTPSTTVAVWTDP